jgi:hypothetical protein
MEATCQGVLRTKSIEQSIQDTEETDHKLRKELSAWDLTVFGIGGHHRDGIFVLAGVACALAALCTPSPPAPCRWPAAPTPSPTPPWAS